MRIVVMGVAGSGKTTIGRRIAATLGKDGKFLCKKTSALQTYESKDKQKSWKKTFQSWVIDANLS
jgi:adenylate kinase family enzyme